MILNGRQHCRVVLLRLHFLRKGKLFLFRIQSVQKVNKMCLL